MTLYREIRYQINRFKTFIHRAFHGWGRQDTWNLDEHLSKVIYQSVIYLRDTQSGSPIIMDIKDHNSKEELEENDKQWKLILNKMIQAFQLAHDISIAERFRYDSRMKKEDRLVVNALSKKEDYAMQEGMKLFIKYFHCLWD